MSDNVDITPGSGKTVSTKDIGGIQHERVRSGLELVRISQTPTISAGAIYAAKDVVGTLLTFANAGRYSGGSGRVLAVTVVDLDQERADLDLVLFHTAPTVAADNAIFDPTDGELATCVGWVPIAGGFYSDFNDNSVAHIDVDLAYVLAATSLYGVLVARSTPTYTATTDLSVILTVWTD